MTKEKNNINTVEELKIKKSLNSLSDNGYVKFKEKDDDSFELEINGQAALDVLNDIGEIPLPVSIFKKFKKKTNAKDYRDLLSVILAVSSTNYSITGSIKNLMNGSITVDEDDLAFQANIISEFYDLYNPRLDSSKSIYWFKIKKEILEMFENLAKQQNPNSFPQYFLK